MFPCPSAGHKSMGHVSGVVDTEADGDDDVGAGHSVDGETPEVDEAANVDEGEDHAAEDKQAGPDVEEQHPGGEEDAEDGEKDVPVQLLGDHLVGLPRGVALAHGERLGGEVGVAQDLFHSVHCGNLLLWPVHQVVGEGNCRQLGMSWNKNLISRRRSITSIFDAGEPHSKLVLKLRRRRCLDPVGL